VAHPKQQAARPRRAACISLPTTRCIMWCTRPLPALGKCGVRRSQFKFHDVGDAAEAEGQLRTTSNTLTHLLAAAQKATIGTKETRRVKAQRTS